MGFVVVVGIIIRRYEHKQQVLLQDNARDVEEKLEEWEDLLEMGWRMA